MGKLRTEYLPLGVAVFLVLGGFVGSAVFIRKNGSFGNNGPAAPSFILSAHGAQSSQAVNEGGSAADTLLAAPGYAGSESGYLAQEEGAAFNSQSGTVKDPGGVFADSTSQSGIISYVVQKGDTLPSIAAYFGVTVDTITAANPKADPSKVTPGETLKILPVSGVIYKTQQGDTLSSIASTFGVPGDAIVAENPSVDFGDSSSIITFLNPGISLIIPGATATSL